MGHTRNPSIWGVEVEATQRNPPPPPKRKKEKKNERKEKAEKKNPGLVFRVKVLLL